MYDITKIPLGKNSKIKKFAKRFEENKTKMECLPVKWTYMKSEDGLLLAGRVFLQKDSDKMVILFHGYRSIAENDFSTYFKWYYAQGYSILLIDQRAHGKSEGKYITFGIKESEDCVKWCEYVIFHYPQVKQIVLAGMSMGATTVVLASALPLPKEVKGIVADSAFTSPKQIIAKVANYQYGVDMTILWPILRIICRYKAHFELEKGNVLDALSECNLPILWIHALSDDFVPSKMSKEHFEACHSQKELILVDCVTHGFAHVYEKEKVQKELNHFLKSLT